MNKINRVWSPCTLFCSHRDLHGCTHKPCSHRTLPMSCHSLHVAYVYKAAWLPRHMILVVGSKLKTKHPLPMTYHNDKTEKCVLILSDRWSSYSAHLMLSVRCGNDDTVSKFVPSCCFWPICYHNLFHYSDQFLQKMLYIFTYIYFIKILKLTQYPYKF